MLALLALLFVVVPLAELAVIVRVGHVIGLPETLVLLLAVSIAGAWLVRREGLGVLRRARRELDDGLLPGAELVDGVLVLLAGALLLAPGFLTDAAGLLLLVPAVRGGLRRVARHRLGRRLGVAGRALPARRRGRW